MKSTKVTFCLATLALGVASAASSYSVKLASPMSVGAVQLKAGDYTVEMQGDRAVFKDGRSGKKVVEIPATVGTSDSKFKSTSLMSADSKLQEIDLGGTKSKIVFGAEAPTSGSAGQ
jgi:hypothetical protein